MVDDTQVLYEMMYIIDSTVGEDGINKAMERIKGTIAELGGSIVKDNPWGQRRLAYPIKKRTEGYYVVLEFMLAPSRLKQLNADIRISMDILRHMVLRVPKAKLVQETHDEKVAKQRAAEAHARAAEIAAREGRDKTAESSDKEPKASQENQSHSPDDDVDVHSENQPNSDLSEELEDSAEFIHDMDEDDSSESGIPKD